ncbi:integral membrane family protein [Colletotrichum graminicola M1.001]|uniref:Integral membrane family protein n=1 Tax=Colletotrichum graminicola (strain M1.001 / M2 / FGSC 10212) TaxID=645133 RepID=E3QB90_COLGM|nr:integral membrane family protein [Colletotrichum graminicola M1.001]EFQ28128.1 integral membrane family protein [Colletotrichum graminicola M1.001]
MAEVNLSESNGGALVATAVSFLVLSWFSVLLRCYVRAFMTNGFQVDDWFMVVAQVIFTLSCSFILAGVDNGLGRHNRALSQRQEISALMYQALATATYVLGMLFIKLSIGFFLLRLSTSRVYNWVIHVSLAIVTIWSVVIFFWNTFQCSPIEAQWDYTISNAECVPADAVVAAAYSISVMTILSDWLYALLPIPMVWGIEMTIQAKATVIVILGLGIFASIATLIRLRYLADLGDVADILFTGTDPMVWTLVEPGVAIVASSLVTVRPLLRAWRLTGFASTNRTPGMSGAISGGMRSGTVRSAARPTPRNDPYGAGDVGPTELELGDMGKHEPKPWPKYRIGYTAPFAQFGSKVAGGQIQANSVTPPGRERRRSSDESMYVVEGGKTSDTWRDDRTGSPSVSSADLDGLDAQSQHSGRVGLGGRRG